MYYKIALFAGFSLVSMCMNLVATNNSLSQKEVINLWRDHSDLSDDAYFDSKGGFIEATAHHTAEEPGLETEVFGMGQILSVNREARLITIKHRAVEIYGWSEGEFTLAVAPSIVFDEVPKNGEIFFGLARTAEGTFIVTALFL